MMKGQCLEPFCNLLWPYEHHFSTSSGKRWTNLVHPDCTKYLEAKKSNLSLEISDHLEEQCCPRT